MPDLPIPDITVVQLSVILNALLPTNTAERPLLRIKEGICLSARM